MNGFPEVRTRFLALVVAALFEAMASSAQEPPLAILSVDVVDVVGGVLVEGQTVVLRHGKIAGIGADTSLPANARSIDGRGKFLIPGLWDMHVHIRHPAAPDILFPQFIAHGVTGVRDMSSDCREPGPDDTCAEQLREWARAIDEGTLPGPRIVALSSWPLNPPWDAEMTEAEARTLVRSIASRNVDFIKIYYRLSPEAIGWILDEAQKVDLAVGGHIPIRMTSIEVSDAGLTTLEHARDFLFDCFPGTNEFRRDTMSQNPPMETMRSMVDDHDVAACNQVFRAFVRNGTWYVPTHVTRRMDAYADDPDFRDDPRSKYLPARAWEAWQRDADGMIALDPTPEGRRTMRGFYEKGLQITGRAFRAGVNIVLGTDAGDTYVFPGSGAHDELSELVKAGLSPAEALAAATIRSAELLGLESDYGSLELGKQADMVLLNANPLEDIAHTRQIEAVILGGKMRNRGELDVLLRQVEARVLE